MSEGKLDAARRCVRGSLAVFGASLLWALPAHADLGSGPFPFTTKALGTPTVTTAANPTNLNLGQGVLHASATISARTTPAASTLDFNVYGPNDTACTGAVIYNEERPVPISAGPTTVSTQTGFTPTATGRYRWRATYNGDASNTAATSLCNEDDDANHAIVNKAATTIATTASAPGELGDITLNDTATIGGRFQPQPGATVEFKLYGPNDSTCGPVVHSETVTMPTSENSVTTATGFTPVKAGTYQWIASYSGDVNNASKEGVCNTASEMTVVDKHIPTLITSPSATQLALAAGLQLTDSVTVADRINPVNGANVEFRLYGPNDLACSGTPVRTQTGVNYNANAGLVTSNAFTPNTAGIYRWRVTYTGDQNNARVVSPCSAANQTDVTKALPTLTPHPSSQITIGSGTLSDVVTVSGRQFAQSGATMDFRLYGPNDLTCAGPVAFQVLQVSVAQAGSPNVGTPAFAPLKAGTYRWKVSYSGDLNNQAVDAPCSGANETVVLKETPSISSTASGDIALGEGTLTDEAVVSGGLNPRGTVTFRVYGPGDTTCATPLDESTRTYNAPGATVTSDAYEPHAPGDYRWIATYSGDDNNAADAGSCSDLQARTTVEQAQPTISTDASAGVALGSGTLTADATIAGEFERTGTGSVVFTLFPPEDPTCSGGGVFTSTKVAATTTVTSDEFSPTKAGTFRWKAHYTGDVNNKVADSSCASVGASVIVFKATPNLQTLAVPGAVPLGSGTVSATATVSARVSALPGAEVSFKLFGPDDPSCTGVPVFTSDGVPVPVSGDPTVSSEDYTPQKAGTYKWAAHFSGEANNAAIDDNCGDAEQNVAVGGVTPTLTTSASPDVVLGTGSLTNSATLTGRVNPSSVATVDFKLYGPDDPSCTGTPAFAALDVPYPVAGGAVRSESFAPTRAGTYRWITEYSGDGNNEAVTGACNAAGAVVNVARSTPSLVATPSPTITLGTGSMTDTVVVNGRLSPTEGGVVDFRAYAPSDTACSGAPVFQSLGLAYLPAGGPATSAAFTPTRAGMYRWVAAYRGDANNAPVSTACGPDNATTVAPGPPGQRVPNRAQTRRVSASTTPKRDPTKLYTFTTTGRVTPPPYCATNASPAVVGADCVLPICPADSIDPADCTRPARKLLCSAGKLTVRFLRLAYTVSTRSVGLRPDCTYRSTVSLKTSSPLRRGVLTVKVRFEGNSFLLPRRAAKHIVHAGPGRTQAP